MAISLETAIKHYTYLDRRSVEKRPTIAHNLGRLAAQGFPAGEKLDSIVRSAYLAHEYVSRRGDNATVKLFFDVQLDKLLAQLSGLWLFPSRLGTKLSELETSFRGGVETSVLKGRSFPSETSLDLDHFPDRLLITSLAFVNYCRQACAHCGGAGQWDERSHTLEELKAVRDKIRFPVVGRVGLTWQEPFTLPFLLDAVKYLLNEGTSVSLVSSLLGTSRKRREELLKGMQEFYDQYDGRARIKLSFDLFRPHQIDSYLELIADALNRYPVINELTFSYNHFNRAESIQRLNQLLGLVKREEIKQNINRLLHNESLRDPARKWTEVDPVGEAAAFDINLAISYLRSKQERYFTERRISPYSQGLFLFPGGDIAPECNWEAPQIRSLGNIFTHQPREIYERYNQFESRYLMRRAQEVGAYDSLLDTEVEMRGWHGIREPLVNHYLTLTQLDPRRKR